MDNTPHSSHLEDYWPCAGESLATNAIGTPMRDTINVGLTRWKGGGEYKPASKHQIQSIGVERIG